MTQEMLTFSQVRRFTEYLFDRPEWADRAAHILRAILLPTQMCLPYGQSIQARSPRLSDIAERMPGSPQAGYKAIQRFLAQVDPKEALRRLYYPEAPFVLVDVTEIPRPQARRTSYVGRLRDGKTLGFWLLVLATPYRGRAIPFSFVSYSSQTLSQSGVSRNLEHRRALGEVRELLGDRPLVMDREFSYGGLLEGLQEAGIPFVVRLRAWRQAVFIGEDGKERRLVIGPGERKVYRGLY